MKRAQRDGERKRKGKGREKKMKARVSEGREIV